MRAEDRVSDRAAEETMVKKRKVIGSDRMTVQCNDLLLNSNQQKTATSARGASALLQDEVLLSMKLDTAPHLWWGSFDS